MMKRAIWARAIFAIVIVLLGAFFVNVLLRNKAEREAERSEAKRIEEATKALVAQLVARTKAIDTWEQALIQGQGFRVTILTVELERLWLTDRPILFMGTIQDIATADKENYWITVERGPLSGFVHPIPNLRLALRAPKQEIDSFLKSHPNLFNDFDLYTAS
jgi:hypothetical protein